MKRTLLSLLLCGTLLVGSVAALPVAADDLGDVDGDGAITSKDARIVANYAMKLDDQLQSEHPELADVDGDGEVSLTDARIILQYYAGKLPGVSGTTVRDGGALPEDFFAFSPPTFDPLGNTIRVTVKINTPHYLLDGMIYLSYPTDKAELVLMENSNTPHSYSQMTPLTNAAFNTEWEKDVTAVGFYDVNGHAPQHGDEDEVLKLTFRLKEGYTGMFPLSVWADYMMAYDTPMGSVRFTGSREGAKTVNLGIPTISITPPTKTMYLLGEELDLTDGCVTLTYEDGSVWTLPLEDGRVNVSGFNSHWLGKQTITISYAGVTIDYEVEVVEPVVVYIGDVDLDGWVTSTDARIVLQYYTGKFTNEDVYAMYDGAEGYEEVFYILADVDEDGKITSTDARLILQYYAGKI